MPFLEIIKLEFGKKKRHTLLSILLFFSIIISRNAWFPQFSFWFLIALAMICFFRLVTNHTKILLGTVLKFMISSTFDSIEFIRLNLDRPTPATRLIQTDRRCEDRLWVKYRSFHESNLLNKSRSLKDSFLLL